MATVRVVVQAQFELVCVTDGSKHCIEVFGEAIDSSDKATAKAMSAAFKAATIQTFCIPVTGQLDPDAAQRVSAPCSAVEAIPVQGWEQWTADIIDMIVGCETWDAVEHVQRTYRSQLRALSLQMPECYKQVGVEVSRKKAKLSPTSSVDDSARQAPSRLPMIAADGRAVSALVA